MYEEQIEALNENYQEALEMMNSSSEKEEEIYDEMAMEEERLELYLEYLRNEDELRNEYDEIQCCYINRSGCSCSQSATYYEWCGEHAEIELGMRNVDEEW